MTLLSQPTALSRAAGCRGAGSHGSDSHRTPVDVGRQRRCVHRFGDVEDGAKEQHLEYYFEDRVAC